MLIVACLALLLPSEPEVERLRTWPLTEHHSHLPIPLDNGRWTVWESKEPQPTTSWHSTGDATIQNVSLALPVFLTDVGLSVGLEGGPLGREVKFTELAPTPDGSVTQRPARFLLPFLPVMSYGGQMWGRSPNATGELICLNPAGMFAYPLTNVPFRVGDLSDFSKESVLAAAGNRSIAVVLSRAVNAQWVLRHQNWIWNSGKWSILPPLGTADLNPDDYYLFRPRTALQSGVYGDLMPSLSLDLDDPQEAVVRQYGVGLVRVAEGRPTVLVKAPDTARVVGEDGDWLVGYMMRHEEDDVFVCRIAAKTGRIQRLEVGLKPEESIRAMYWNEKWKSFLILANDTETDSLRAISGFVRAAGPRSGNEDSITQARSRPSPGNLNP